VAQKPIGKCRKKNLPENVRFQKSISLKYWQVVLILNMGTLDRLQYSPFTTLSQKTPVNTETVLPRVTNKIPLLALAYMLPSFIISILPSPLKPQGIVVSDYNFPGRSFWSITPWLHTARSRLPAWSLRASSCLDWPQEFLRLNPVRTSCFSAYQAGAHAG
jgi:hypothetical protein